MPPQPKCECEACQSRRDANWRWHNKPEVKLRRLAANAEYKRRKRIRTAQKSQDWLRRSTLKEPTDTELDAKALENWPAEWEAR